MNLRVRHLAKGDYDKGYIQLLGQLTDVGSVDKTAFEACFQELQNPLYRIVVIEDVDKKEVVATATLLIEKKFIHGCSKVGHIEDVVVSNNYRGQKLGQRVIDALVQEASDSGCYKVILDCSASNVPFYEKCGFQNKDVCMAMYFEKSKRVESGVQPQ